MVFFVSMSSFPGKRIAIFGSTGSIGTQALEVVAANPSLFSVEVLTAQNNDSLLIQQGLKFKPNIIVIGDERKYQKVKDAFSQTDTKVFCGEKALEAILRCHWSRNCSSSNRFAGRRGD